MRRHLFAHEEDDLNNPGMRRHTDTDNDYAKQAQTTRWWLNVLQWPAIRLRMKNGYRIEYPLYQQIMKWGTEAHKQEVMEYVNTQPGGGFGETSVGENVSKETISQSETKKTDEGTNSLTEEQKSLKNQTPLPSTEIVEEPVIPGELHYTVQPGDILLEVGERSGLNSTEFFRLNKQVLARPGRELFPGEILRFPPHSKIGLAAEPSAQQTFPPESTTNTMAPVNTGKPGDDFGYIVSTTPEYYITYGIYYGKVVPAIAIVTSSRKQAQEFAEEMGYQFYYDINPKTRARSVLRQKGATEVYNRAHYSFSVQLIDEVNAVAQDYTLRNKAVSEGNLGEAFTQLVRHAQEIVLGPDYYYIGMYDEKSRNAVKQYIELKNTNAAPLTNPYAIENLNENIRNDATIAQQVAIISIQGTGKLYEYATQYLNHNWDEEMRERYFYKILKYRETEPEWSVIEWQNFLGSSNYKINGIDRSFYHCSSVEICAQKGLDESHRKHLEAWNFFNLLLSDGNFVYDAPQQLYLLIELEGAQPYSRPYFGRFTNYTDFRAALSTYMQHVNDGQSTASNVVQADNPSLKGFYENYLYKSTTAFIDERENQINFQYHRYVSTDNQPKPELFALMEELTTLKDEIKKISIVQTKVSSVSKVVGKAETVVYYEDVSSELAQIDGLKQQLYKKLAAIAEYHVILNSREFKNHDEKEYNYTSVLILVDHAEKKDTAYFISKFKSIKDDRLEKINDLRKQLAEDPDKIWLFDQLVAATQNNLGFVSGTVYHTIIQGWQQQVKNKYAPSTILMMVNAVLGLVSLFVPPTLLLTGALAVSSGILLAESIEEYSFKNAASGTGFSNKDSLAEAPSLIWVILNSVALVFDGLAFLQAVSAFRAVGKDLSLLLFDKSGRLITDPEKLVAIEKQAYQLLLTRGVKEAEAARVSKQLTNREFLLRMEREQAARDALLVTKKNTPLMPLPKNIQQLLADPMLGALYTAGAYRLQDTLVGNTHLLDVFTRIFADYQPRILSRIIRSCGESEPVAAMLGKIHAGMAGSNNTFNYTHFIQSEFGRPTASYIQFFNRLDGAGIQTTDVAKAAENARAGRTTLEAANLFRATLLEKVALHETSLLHAPAGKPAQAAGAATSSNAQQQLANAVEQMNEPQLEQFLKDLNANHRGMDAAEYAALKTQGEAALLKQIELKILDPVTGQIDPAKLRTLLSKLEKQGIRTLTGKEAEVILRQHNANALYIPHDVPGMPGTLVFSNTANRMQVMEELMHLEQHRITGFRELTGGEIIEMEIDAHSQMLAYARGKGWTKEEVELLERNKRFWEADKTRYEKDEIFREDFDLYHGAFASRIDEPVPGLWESIDPAYQPKGVRFEDVIEQGDLPNQVKVRTNIEFDGVAGKSFFIRIYDKDQKMLVLSHGFIAKNPITMNIINEHRWIKDVNVPLVLDKGIPTQMYVTLRQLKLMNINPSEIKFVKMSTIQNEETTLFVTDWLKRTKSNDLSKMNNLVLDAPSMQYAKSTITQMGLSIQDAKILTGNGKYAIDSIDILRSFGFKYPDDLLVKYGLISSDYVHYNFDILLSIKTKN
jgi:hypothetical protein